MEIAVTQQWEVWLTWNERDVSWIWCWMHNGIDLGHGAWQIDRPSNGSMWNSYSFQPVGQWMGYSFTDLGAEGCCPSLNALFILLLRLCCFFSHSARLGHKEDLEDIRREEEELRRAKMKKKMRRWRNRSHLLTSNLYGRVLVWHR